MTDLNDVDAHPDLAGAGGTRTRTPSGFGGSMTSREAIYVVPRGKLA